MKVWEEFLKVEGWNSQYPSVDKTLKHYLRKIGSEKTKENFCSALMFFCKHAHSDPDTLVGLAPAEATKVCQGFTDQMKQKGFSIRYVNVTQAYMKTFFKENGLTENDLRVERYHQPARYRKKPEYIPDSEEIYRMGYASGSAKNRAMIFGAYTGGLRNSTLRAQRYKDVREELEAGKNIIKVPVYPEMKQVDPAACKGNIPYYSFYPPETVKALKDYLEERKQKFGEIRDNDPLFCSDSNNVAPDKQRERPVSKNGFGQMVKRAARQAAIRQWRDVTPKCLRTAFESAMRNNKLDPKDQEFLMGHILPGVQDPYYDSSKVEELRAKYSGIPFFKKSQMDAVEMIKKFAETLGIKNVEIKIAKMKEKQSKIDETEALGKIIREELGLKPMTIESGRKRKETNQGAQKRFESKIVSEGEVVSCVEGGWEIIKELKNGKLVVRRDLT